jgi:hypothetical protein
VCSMQSTALRQAVTRLRSAAQSCLEADTVGALPLGEVRTDELRVAALRALALMDPQVPEYGAALADGQQQRAELAVRALSGLNVHDLAGEVRFDLVSAIAVAHADLRTKVVDEVTRALLDSTPVGPGLAELVFGVDPALLDPDAQVSFCQAAQRLESATHARLGGGLIAFAGNNPRHTHYWVDGDDYELSDVRSSELASALSWSGVRARGAVESARLVNADLDDVREAAASGSLQPAAVSVIADGAQTLTSSLDREIVAARAALAQDSDSGDDIAHRVWELTGAREEMLQQYDDALTSFAATHTVAETRRKVRDTLAKLDPEGFRARRDDARSAQSSVEFRALPDAMAMITAVMPAEHATACYRAIDTRANAAEADPAAPVGVRRSDALLAFCAQTKQGARHSGDAAGEPAESSGAATSAHVDLVMTMDAFLGLAETPAECVGTGPIPAAAAREFLAASELVTFRRILVDGQTGRPLDIGVRRYQLTDAERDYIFARDRTCRRPGCNQPASRCEVDHAVPYASGGVTQTDNLGALCVRHHQEKTHAGWSITDSAADGSCVFVSPLGRRYLHEPEPALPWAGSE